VNEGCNLIAFPQVRRRGSVTYQLSAGVPKEVISDRMNVSDEVLEKHYDERTAGERGAREGEPSMIAE